MPELRDFGFKIAGEAVPKKRPRLGRHGVAYTPAETKTWEEYLGYQMNVVMHQFTMVTYPIKVRIVFNLPYSQKNKHGDIDNLAKSVLDAGNGIVWKDDRLIKQLHVYIAFSEFPDVTVQVTELEGE